jgi:diacylglycerol kinase (ATP)
MTANAAPRAITLLVNPAAGRGQGAVVGDRAERALAQHGPVVRVNTQRGGDERTLAREAAAAGTPVLVVVGGDGSVHHAARGLLDAATDTALAIISAGTGNDFVKSLDSPAHDVEAMAARVITGTARRVDVGFIDEVPFLNAAGFGFDVEVLQRMLRPMRLRGTAAYVSTALGALLGYTGFSAALGARGETVPRRHLMTVFANGRCFGGAFRIAPGASLDDGALDVVDIGNVPPWRRPSLFLRAVRGTHVSQKAVLYARGASFEMRFDAPPHFEADGELYQATHDIVRVRVQPHVLTLIV